MKTNRRSVLFRVLAGITFALLAVPALHSSELYAEDGSSDKQKAPLIKVMDLSEGSKKASGIKFADPNLGKPVIIKLAPNETAAISPNAVLAGILKFARVGEPRASLRIYDRTGTQILEFKVAPLDKIAIADDGRFAVYGFEPTTEIATESRLQFYQRDGKAVVSRTEHFGLSHVGTFSQSDGLFVFLADEDAVFTDPHPVVVLIFDKDYRQKGSRRFEDWPLYAPLQKPIIDKKRGQVKLFRATGKGTNLTKETVFLDFSGDIKATERGWSR